MGLLDTRKELKEVLDKFDDSDPILGLLAFIVSEPEAVKQFVDRYHAMVIAEVKLADWFDEA